MDNKETPPPPYPTGDANYPQAPYPQASAYPPPTYLPQAQGGYPQQPSYAPPAYPPQAPQMGGGFPQQPGYQPVAQYYPEKGGVHPYVQYSQSPNTVIVSQPGQVVINAQEPMPSATGAVCLSCFVFLCCCWPLGCVAFIFAMMASSTVSPVDARKKISLANKVSIAGVVCGTIIIIFLIVMEISGSNSNNHY